MQTANLNERERRILVGILRDRDDLASREQQAFGGDRYARARENVRIAAARDGWVHIDAARWLGRSLTTSDRTLNSRAYAHLESLGLIERYADQGRYTTHLKLIAEGERIAADLTATEDADARPR